MSVLACIAHLNKDSLSCHQKCCEEFYLDVMHYDQVAASVLNSALGVAWPNSSRWWLAKLVLGGSLVSIGDICLVSTADICPVSAADFCPVSTCTSKDRKAHSRLLVNCSMQHRTKTEAVSWKLSAAISLANPHVFLSNGWSETLRNSLSMILEKVVGQSKSLPPNTGFRKGGSWSPWETGNICNG